MASDEGGWERREDAGEGVGVTEETPVARAQVGEKLCSNRWAAECNCARI